MKTNEPAADPMANASREEIISALFANLIIQQTNMAFMFLGRVPHPETGEVVQDFESAKFFIDQLDMIETKTKGNLDKREEGLLKQSLTGLRMAFVEAMNEKGAAPQQKPIVTPTGEPAKPDESSAPAAPAPANELGSEIKAAPEAKAAPEDESRKKFSKKY